MGSDRREDRCYDIRAIDHLGDHRAPIIIYKYVKAGGRNCGRLARRRAAGKADGKTNDAQRQICLYSSVRGDRR